MRKCTLETLEGRTLFNLATFGDEKVIQNFGTVADSDVAVSRNGSFVAATIDTTSVAKMVHVQRYDINGTTMGASTIVVSLAPSLGLTDVSVSIDDDGDAVVSYLTSESVGSQKINFNTISRTGVLGSRVVVDTITFGPDDLRFFTDPDISMGGNGSFFVGWIAQLSSDHSEVRMHAYNANGSSRAAQFVADDNFATSFESAELSISSTPDANSAAFAFTFEGGDNGDSSVVFGRVNTTALIGQTHTPQTKSLPKTSHTYNPSIATYADGAFVVAYSDSRYFLNDDFGDDYAFVERYDASGNRIGDAIRLGESIGDGTAIGVSSVAVLPDGGFVVSSSGGALSGDANKRTIFVQRFTSAGTSDDAGPVDVDTTTPVENLGAFRGAALGADGYGTVLLGYAKPTGTGTTFAQNLRRLTGALAIIERKRLYVLGSRKSDNIEIFQAGSGTIIVRNRISGGGEKRFGGDSASSVDISGSNGNDRIINDTDFATIAHGGSGNDTIFGGTTANLLFGNTGNDYLFGSLTADSLYGDAGDDTLRGDGATDHLEGGAGNDELRGEFGNDDLHGGAGNDKIIGGAGGDAMYGDAGNDRIYGEQDNDLAYGGTGRDFFDGGDGHDRFNSTDGEIDQFFGRGGRDSVHGDSIDELTEVEATF